MRGGGYSWGRGEQLNPRNAEEPHEGSDVSKFMLCSVSWKGM